MGQQVIIDLSTLIACIATFLVLSYIAVRATIARDLRFAAFVTICTGIVGWFVAGYIAILLGWEIISATYFRPAMGLLMISLAWAVYLAWQQREYVSVLQDVNRRLEHVTSVLASLNGGPVVLPTAPEAEDNNTS